MRTLNRTETTVWHAPPPQDDSTVQQQELSDLKRLLAARTPERFKQAQWDRAHETSLVFASAIGPVFDLAGSVANASKAGLGAMDS